MCGREKVGRPVGTGACRAELPRKSKRAQVALLGFQTPTSVAVEQLLRKCCGRASSSQPEAISHSCTRTADPLPNSPIDAMALSSSPNHHRLPPHFNSPP